MTSILKALLAPRNKVKGGHFEGLFRAIAGATRASDPPVPLCDLELSCCSDFAILIRNGSGETLCCAETISQIIFFDEVHINSHSCEW